MSRIGAEERRIPATGRSSRTDTTSRGCWRSSSGRSSSRSGRRPASDGATCSRADTGAGSYPFVRAAMCVVRPRPDRLLGDLGHARGRPAIYATFSSYDEVAHHSGLERARHARGAPQARQAARPDRAGAPLAPRPYEIVVLSDHGQTQGATFKQRNGYGLDELVAARSMRGAVADASRR